MSERSALSTALDSVRRSRNLARRQNDAAVAKVLLRAEAALVSLEAEREGVEPLIYPGEKTDDPGPQPG